MTSTLDSLVIAALYLLCAGSCALLVHAIIARRRKRAAARKWWLQKIGRMCNVALQKYACEVCKKAEGPCYDQDRHILLERIRRWRIWAEYDYAEWLLSDGAEKKLGRLLKGNA